MVECKCLNKLILDKNGFYSMDLLKAHDTDWHELITVGLKWEMLSHKMDIEDPEAALVISVALNKKTKQA